MTQNPENNSTTDEAVMPFTAHLAELRKRLAIIFSGIGIGAICCFAFAEPLFAWISSPLAGYFEDAVLIGTGPAEAFIVKLKVAVTAGLVLTCPLTFYQLWLFIAPGLHEHERKQVVPFVLASTAFFLVGLSFCFYVVLPFALDFFEHEFRSIGVAPQVKIGEYLGFAVKLLLVFGAIFELPVITYFLARLGLVNHHWLTRNARYAILGVFVIAAILTPPISLPSCY